MQSLLEWFETDGATVTVIVVGIVSAALVALGMKLREMGRQPRRWCFWHGEWWGEGECPECGENVQDGRDGWISGGPVR